MAEFLHLGGRIEHTHCFAEFSPPATVFHECHAQAARKGFTEVRGVRFGGVNVASFVEEFAHYAMGGDEDPSCAA